MSKRDKDDQAKVFLVQKHQLNTAQQQVGKICSEIDTLQAEFRSNDQMLSNMIAKTESYIDASGIEWADDEDDCYLINSDLYLDSHEVPKQSRSLDLLDYVDADSATWSEYLEKVGGYANSHNIDLTDPYRDLMNVSQRVELEKLIKAEFTLKTASCDKYDYMIAGTCGLIGGLIDVFLVGAPGEGYLTKFTDDVADGAVQKFAKFMGWKGARDDKDTTASAIGYLERNYKVNYDQATSSGHNGTGGAVKNMSMSNHHLKSLGHSPDLVGLFFSILDQFNSTAHFVSNGKLVSIDTESFELKGYNLASKIFCGFCNWLSHLFSDMAGSSGTRGNVTGGRGAGIPIPFYSLLQFVNVGEFGRHKQTFATVAVKVFEDGYDFRHGMALAIPVLISELLTRIMWVVKQRYYHEREWKECIPSANQPELRRMLLIAHGSLCLVDGADAAIRSGGELVQFMLRINLIAWARFGTLTLKELNAWYSSGGLDIDAVDEYLDAECKRLLAG